MDDHRTIADLSRTALDRRLDRASIAPIVVAFSGGGDSLALLIGADRWARGAGRRVLAVTIDHRLQPDSARWAAWCAERAGREDVEHQILVWDGEKPRTGLAAAARAVRHRLLAGAAAGAGASVILLGHTVDDRLEARLMRAAGGSVPEPREWSPSPVWPDGRGLFLLRPLLGARRATIRERLRAAAEAWLDDPANADPRHPRVRARLDLAGGGDPEPDVADVAPTLDPVTITAAGEITFPVPPGSTRRPARAPTLRLDAGGAKIHRAVFGAALLCASGGDRPPRRDRLDRLRARLEAGETFTATLAGARVEADTDHLRIVREAGDIARAGAPPLVLPRGEPVVWDGRFEIQAKIGGLWVEPLAGLTRRLGRAERSALTALRPAVRKSLPAIVDLQGGTSAPLLVPHARVSVRSLVASRFLAACGGVQNEADIAAHGETRADTLNR